MSFGFLAHAPSEAYARSLGRSRIGPRLARPQADPSRRSRKIEAQVEMLNNSTHFPPGTDKLSDVPPVWLWPEL